MQKEVKKKAILRSVLKLVNREGFYHINMKKVAKVAGIATGTIYLYFSGKESLINELYRLIITTFNKEVLKGFNGRHTLKHNFDEMIHRALTFYLNDPEMFSFIEQYTYAPFLFKENKDENFVILWPIYKMIRRGKKEGIVKPLPESFHLSIIHGSLMTIIKLHLAGKENLNDEKVKAEFCKMIWEAIVIEKDSYLCNEQILFDNKTGL